MRKKLKEKMPPTFCWPETLAFQNPHNDYIVTVSPFAPLWHLIFGFFYLFARGVYGHAIVQMLTFPFSWWIYPFFTRCILRRYYLERGWTEIS